ncbi:MAG TPA: hypothetical protein VE177_00895, partial [Candidatus Binatus sp.]|nr:hypothetical protein [Candidatus Binatus sp.]
KTEQLQPRIKSSFGTESSKHYLRHALTATRAPLVASPGSNLTLQSSEPQKTRSITPTTLLYWMRLGFAVVAGVLYNLLGFGTQGVSTGTALAIGVGIGVYAISVFLVKYVLRYDEKELKGPNKHITLGIGTYIIWFLFTLVLLNTMLNPGPYQ